MTYQITQTTLTPELQKHIFKCFSNYSIDKIGVDGLDEEPIVFEIREEKQFLGCIVVQMFWGQLHIKYFMVEEKYRDHGIGQKLMEHALAYGKSRGCNFAFVETMSFQAPEFYKKFGFKIELKRDGYSHGTSFYYLCKNLNDKNDFNIIIRKFEQSDISTVVSAFAANNWLKPASTFEAYLKEQENNHLLIWIAEMNKEFAGYVTLGWQSHYEPFAKASIPEIMDLNVLPSFRHHGIGSKLLETAEKEASTKTDIVGLGTGLYSDYGAAQKLYITHGYIPDGNGVTYNYNLARPGMKYPLDDDLILWFTKRLK